jgi:hypothetical protein
MQTDRETGRQAGRQTDRQTGQTKYRETEIFMTLHFEFTEK